MFSDTLDASMMNKVDTFEQDIAEEIKRKEASMSEIAVASSATSNPSADIVELPKKPPVFFYALITVFSLSLFGIGLLSYFYFTKMEEIAPLPKESVTPLATPKTTTTIETLSPTLASQLSRFITSVDKKDLGYVITINDYGAVFSYMSRNEENYAKELLSVLNESTTSSTTNPVPKKDVPAASSSLPSTQPSGTSTDPLALLTGSSTPPQEGTSRDQIVVSDATIANQNMRIITYNERTVVYAFVGNTTLLIANSKEAILALKSVILN